MIDLTDHFVLSVYGIANPVAVQRLDPIGLDDSLKQLHTLTNEKRVYEIVDLLKRLLPLPSTYASYSQEECLAAMRDLGIFLGTLKKLGAEPVQLVPKLIPLLCELGNRTNLPPRDTLLHYTFWNPNGERMRTYTGTNDERALVESVKMAYSDLLVAIIMLDRLYDKAFEGKEFETICQVIRDNIESMVNGIVHAKRLVSPTYFANELRFYYEPILVDKPEPYIGPGAVEMPMFLFDHILWNCDLKDADYEKFKEGYLPFNFQFIRDMYWKYKNKQSVWSIVIENLETHPSEETVKAAEAALGFSYILKSFRMPHKKLADQSYSHKEEFNKQTGSGGYTVDILQRILDLQNDKIHLLQESIHNVKGS